MLLQHKIFSRLLPSMVLILGVTFHSTVSAGFLLGYAVGSGGKCKPPQQVLIPIPVPVSDPTHSILLCITSNTNCKNCFDPYRGSTTPFQYAGDAGYKFVHNITYNIVHDGYYYIAVEASM